MSKADIEKYFVYILCSIIFGLGLVFYPTIINDVTLAYVSIIGVFLGIDMANTLVKTNNLPEGQYQPIKKDRYVVCFIITGLFFLTEMILKKKFDIDLEGSATVLTGAIFLIGSIFIANLETNKLLTGKAPEAPIKDNNIIKEEIK